METAFVVLVVVILFFLILKVIYLNDELKNALKEINYLKEDGRDKFYKLYNRDVEFFNLITDYLDVELEYTKTKLVKKG